MASPVIRANVTAISQAVRLLVAACFLTTSAIGWGQGNTPPTISPFSDVAIPENTTTNIQFLVSAPDNPLSSLILEAASTNETLIMTTSCLFFGQTNRVVGLPPNSQPQTSLISLSLVPNAFRIGESDIIIMLISPDFLVTNVVTARFHLTVSVGWSQFLMSPIRNQEVVPAGVVGPVAFEAFDTVALPSNLIVTGRSSNQALVRDENIVITQSAQSNILNGTFTITTEASAPYGEHVLITLIASNGVESATSTFNLGFVPPPRLSILQVQDTNGLPSASALKITLANGVPNVAYTLQSTSDFNQWKDVTNVMANATGVAEFDLAVGRERVQFFRAR